MASVFTTSGPHGLQISTGNNPDRFARNGDLTDGVKMSQLAGLGNVLSGRRLHPLAQGGDGIGTYVGNSVSSTGRGEFHLSPNSGGVAMFALVANGTSPTLMPKIQWTLELVGGGVEVQPAIYTGGGGTDPGPDGLCATTQRFKMSGADLQGDATYRCHVVCTNASLQTYIIYELPRSVIVTGSAIQSTLGYDCFGVGSPILDRDLSRLQDAMWTIYKRQGVTHFAYTHTSGTHTEANTTQKNVLDNSTGGWSSSAAGFWVIPEKKNRLCGTTVAVRFWAYGGTTLGTGGEVRFVGSGGTIATVTGFTDTIDEIRTVDATLDATVVGSQLVIAEHAFPTGAGEHMRTWAVGCYEIE